MLDKLWIQRCATVTACFEKGVESVGIEGERMGRVYPLPQPTRGSIASSSAGSGVGPRPKLDFVGSECQRSHLVARISVNFLPQFYSGCAADYQRKAIRLSARNAMAKAIGGHSALRSGTAIAVAASPMAPPMVMCGCVTCRLTAGAKANI